MFTEAMRETLREDLRVINKMLDGIAQLAIAEQQKIGKDQESVYLRQLRRDIAILYMDRKNTKAWLDNLEKSSPVGVGET